MLEGKRQARLEALKKTIQTLSTKPPAATPPQPIVPALKAPAVITNQPPQGQGGPASAAAIPIWDTGGACGPARPEDKKANGALVKDDKTNNNNKDNDNKDKDRERKGGGERPEKKAKALGGRPSCPLPSDSSFIEEVGMASVNSAP